MKISAVLLAITTVASSYQSFLQLSEELEFFSDTASENMDSIQSELESVKTEYDLEGTAVIEKDIELKQEELGEVNNQLQEMEDSESACHELSSCEDCVSDDKCIWCNVDNTCYSGNEEGPLYGTCYSFHTHYCDTFCEDYHFYEQCVNNVECGWCDETSVCSQITSYVCSSEHFFTNGVIHDYSQKDYLEQEKNGLENDIYILSETIDFQNQYTEEIGGKYSEQEVSTETDWTQNMSADFEISV